VKRKMIILSAALVTGMNAAQAFNFGNIMNPGKWFDDNDHDRYYYGRRYGGYGPYGWGGGPYGGYGPYGWGGGPYGWGGGPYGWGGYGGQPSTIVVTPSSDSKAHTPKTPE